MKKVIVFLVAFAFSASCFALTITVYGKNEGSDVTTTDNGDGTSTTTVTVDCNSFYTDICYKVEYTVGPSWGDKLTFGNNPTPIVEGNFVSQDSGTDTVVFITQ